MALLRVELANADVSGAESVRVRDLVGVSPGFFLAIEPDRSLQHDDALHLLDLIVNDSVFRETTKLESNRPYHR